MCVWERKGQRKREKERKSGSKYSSRCGPVTKHIERISKHTYTPDEATCMCTCVRMTCRQSFTNMLAEIWILGTTRRIVHETIWSLSFSFSLSLFVLSLNNFFIRKSYNILLSSTYYATLDNRIWRSRPRLRSFTFLRGVLR